MKIGFDWKGGILPALRTAGALMVGNAGVTFLLGTANLGIALTMSIYGVMIISVCSISRR
jgi:hypothetical protein